MKILQNSIRKQLFKLAAPGAIALCLVFPLTAQAAGVVATNGKLHLPGKDSIESTAYVTLENTTDQELVVIRIRTSAFGISMISQAVSDNNQQRELLRADLVLKPNSKLVMKKGGVHLLFAGPKQKLKAGKTITADFYLNDSEKIPVEFKIVK